MNEQYIIHFFFFFFVPFQEQRQTIFFVPEYLFMRLYDIFFVIVFVILFFFSRLIAILRSSSAIVTLGRSARFLEVFLGILASRHCEKTSRRNMRFSVVPFLFFSSFSSLFYMVYFSLPCEQSTSRSHMIAYDVY